MRYKHPDVPTPQPTFREYLDDWEWLHKHSAQAVSDIRAAATKNDAAAIARADGALDIIERFTTRITKRREKKAPKPSRA